jgi:hypothetical protein
MTELRWRQRAGPGLLALGLVGLFGAGRAGAEPSAWTPPDCAATGRAAPAAVAAATVRWADPANAAWYRLDATLDARGWLVGQAVTIGMGLAEPRLLALDAESFAAGPVGGLVLTGSDDGRASTLRIVDVAAGCAWTVATERDVIRHARFDPTGSAILEHRVDRRTRQDLGIWRRPIDGAAPSLAIPAIAPDPRFGPTFATELAWSLDGGLLVVQSCGASACRTRLHDPVSGAVTLVDSAGLGETVGVADEQLIAYEACRGLPCALVTVDVRTGTRTLLSPGAGPAVLVAGADGPRVVLEDVDGGGLRIVDLAGRERGRLDTPGLRLVAGEARARAAVAGPPGWVALAPDGRPGPDPDGGPLLRRVPDDSIVLEEALR